MTVVGVLTVLWGGVHAVLGSGLALGAAAIASNIGGDPKRQQGWGPILDLLAGIVVVVLVVFGVMFLLSGALGLLAGVGVLKGKSWGRPLAFLVAAVAVAVGSVVLIPSINDASDNAPPLAFAAAELLYGVVAVAMLTRSGKSFSRPRA